MERYTQFPSEFSLGNKRKVTAPRQTVFDQSHYLKLIEARGETIRRVVDELKPALELSTALDAGCGIASLPKFSRSGPECRAFDGRMENVEQARARFPQISFEKEDVENPEIRKLGEHPILIYP